MTAGSGAEGAIPPRAVILAAGASTRLGEPKALAQLAPGVCVLEHILACLPETTRPLVVTGAHHEEIARRFEGRAELCWNRSFAEGRTGSLQCALAAIALPPSGLLLWPVDCPGASGADILALLSQWTLSGAPALGWLAPRDPAGRHGHPVVLGQGLLRRVAALEADTPLRVLRAAAAPLLACPLPHAGTSIDLDTPADLAHLRRVLSARGRDDRNT